MAEKTKEISKLQSRIEALRLDDSRAAALERAELEQELAELQKELADTQREHSIESTEDALDKELEDFEDQQDAKIKEIEDFLDDNEKLHKEALNRLEGFNQSFYSNLERYAKKYTDTTSTELTKMWDEAKKAAEEYGTLAGAYDHYSNDFNGTVGDFNASADTNSKAKSIVARMRANSINWFSAGDRKDDLAQANVDLGKELEALLGEKVWRDSAGIWYVGDKKLFEVYHQGTPSVGSLPTPKQNELWALMEKGEMVLTDGYQNRLYDITSGIKNLLANINPLATVMQNAPALAGANGYNITIHSPISMTGDMSESTMRVLKEHPREIADIVSRILKK